MPCNLVQPALETAFEAPPKPAPESRNLLQQPPLEPPVGQNILCNLIRNLLQNFLRNLLEPAPEPPPEPALELALQPPPKPAPQPLWNLLGPPPLLRNRSGTCSPEPAREAPPEPAPELAGICSEVSVRGKKQRK